MSDRRPMLVFDGECGFCTGAAVWLLQRLGEPIDVRPWQDIVLAEVGLDERDVTRWAWWIAPDGSRLRGHDAIARSLEACRMPWPLIGRVLRRAPVSWLGRGVYRVVSRFRGHLPATTPACRREDGWPPPGLSKNPRG